MSNLLPSDAYVEQLGQFCPCCGSEKIVTASATPSSTFIHVDVSCQECHSSWVETYSLTGYGEFESGNKGG